MTLLIIAGCAFVYFGVQQSQAATVYDANQKQVDDVRFSLSHAAIPYELTHGHPLTQQQVANDYGPRAPSLVCSVPGAAVVATSPDCQPHKNIWLAVLYSM